MTTVSWSEGSRPLRMDAVRNRQRILCAARDLFALQGLSPNLNDVARYAHVGVGTVYRRFVTKEALIEEVFADSLDQLCSLAKNAVEQTDSWYGLVWFIERFCELTAPIGVCGR
ncbi:helix-turn-helix transcriptional regulator [Mycolicibacterium farcinogenes]|nr:helix-turn-helix transcriptional regulator [Mycolicibacterium farcinogenes]